MKLLFEAILVGLILTVMVVFFVIGVTVFVEWNISRTGEIIDDLMTKPKVQRLLLLVALIGFVARLLSGSSKDQA